MTPPMNPDDRIDDGDDDAQATLAADYAESDTQHDEEVVHQEQASLREFAGTLTGDDIKSGNWFAKLLTQALSTYTTKVDWAYFQSRYDGVPPDAVVAQRIQMAARYAALEGALSAGAYTAAIAATIGSLGGASPLTMPAAVTTMVVDLAFVTQLQLRLAYDISVLYRVPLDLDDPDDLWKLVKVAFTIRSGEAVREGVVKGVPIFVRPLIKNFYKGPVLAVGRGLPVVGRYLLQRNVIKVGIPLVGVPLATLLNRYTTLVAGRHARAVFRNEARLVELATRLSQDSRHPESLLWVAWLVVGTEGSVSDDEATLMRHLLAKIRKDHAVDVQSLSQVIDLRPDDVWSRLRAHGDDLADVAAAASDIAACDGPHTKKEKVLLTQIERICTDGG